ncbi:MAG: ABC transporter ATP-binding protein, partial [Xanthomonadales bacterium]|nr:ABC transporter ATP-binding protein [Xanthomonadales bacterium]
LPGPDDGQVRLEGRDLSGLGSRQLRQARHKLQIVFQDSGSSLSPRRTIFQSLAEPLEQFEPGARPEFPQRCRLALEQVGLDAELLPRLPHQLSSGQKQRVALARAIIAGPSIIVADEVVSSLDVSVQARMLELISELRREKGIAFLFISHDLSVIAQVADRVAVMYRGRIVESGPAKAVFGKPAHPYTRALLEAIPDPDPDVPFNASLAPDIQNRQQAPGCRFATRCPRVFRACLDTAPGDTRLEDHPEHHVECLLYETARENSQ